MSLSPHTDTPDMPLELPRSRVVLGEVIGEGAFGQVRKAELKVQTDTDGLVRVIIAAKMAKFNHSVDDDSIGKQDAYINLVQEAALMAQFSHPNVIGLVGVCTRQLDQGKPLMLLVQYCRFGSLNSFMKNLPGVHEVRMHTGPSSREVARRHGWDAPSRCPTKRDPVATDPHMLSRVLQSCGCRCMLT